MRCWDLLLAVLAVGSHHGVVAKRLYPHAMEPAQPMITARAKLNLLEKRAVETCGYVSGNKASPLTCPASYSCTSVTNVLFQPGWACCDDIQCPGYWNQCQDYGAESICQGLSDGACSSIYTSILTCSSANPHCFAYAKSQSLGASATYYSLGCGPNSFDILVLQTTTGANEVISAASASDLITEGAGGGVLTTGATQTGTANTIPGQTAISTTSSPASSASASSSSISWKVIVAIVIGGIVALAILAALGCYCSRDYRKRRRYVHTRPHPNYQTTYGGSSQGGTTVHEHPINHWAQAVQPGLGPAPSHYGGASDVHSQPDMSQRY